MGLLDIAVTRPGCFLFCFIFFLAAWRHFRSALATLSLNIVGLIVEPIYNINKTS
ncbi:hypothetical protein HanRHA438_Chr14g0667831 [Helianthus annuus]|nr:hypothetical protein HanRHA438_Chr14g0667831 [Helianthus annuus]